MHFLMQYTIPKKTFIAVKKEDIKKGKECSLPWFFKTSTCI